MTAKLVKEEMEKSECRFPQIFSDDSTGWELAALIVFAFIVVIFEAYFITHTTPTEFLEMLKSFF